MTKRVTYLLPAAALGTTILVWSASFPAIGQALKGLDPLPLASVRFAIASALAIVWITLARPRMMPPADMALCVVCGLISGVGYSVLLNLGQQTISAGAAGFLVKTESLWMALFAVFLLKEKFNSWAWVGMFICVVGVGFIAAAQPGGVALGEGAPLVLAAALCSATGFALQKGLVARYGALPVTAWTFFVSALVLSPWLLQGFEQLHGAPPSIVVWVIFLGVFPTTIGLVCWVYALAHVGVARSSSFLYLVAPLSMVIAWIVADEVPGGATIVGAALILAGVLMVNTFGRE